MGDMRMPEKEGTIVVEWKDRGGQGRVGGLWGKRGGERRVWASGMSGGGEVPVSGRFVSEHRGTPLTSHPFVVNVFGMSCE